MYGTPFSIVPTSWTRATCSLLMRAAACASRTNRATTDGDSASVGRRNLSATRSFKCVWRAATTMPIPPTPSTLSTQYFPARISPDDGTDETADASAFTVRSLPAFAVASCVMDRRDFSRGERARIEGELVEQADERGLRPGRGPDAQL